jgi:hypothetical protein
MPLGSITPITYTNLHRKYGRSWPSSVKPGFEAPIGGFVTVDANSPDQYVTYVGSGGLGLLTFWMTRRAAGQQNVELSPAFLFKAGFGDAEMTAMVYDDFEDKIARDSDGTARSAAIVI